MAQQHDLFDDIIEISKGFGALKDPLNSVADVLTGEKPEEPAWNPADYRERPRGGASMCLRCVFENSSCRACLDVCPHGAIEIEDGSIEILDTCRKCGLCTAVCPTEALTSARLRPKKLYDAIATAATSYETAYVTCARALRRAPRENEVVVACLGDVTAETWFSVLADFSNVSAYLPLDLCEGCKTSTGEEALGDAIATAEEWAGTGLGLEVESQALTCVKRREFERKEFLDNVARTTGLAVSKLNPAAGAISSVTQRLRAHANRITELERALDRACGTTSEKRRRTLLQGRQLVLSALQTRPELAGNLQTRVPVCDQMACTLCGACVSVCPVHATDLVGSGRFAVEPAYCVGCGLCAEACPEHALMLETRDGADLVVPDPEAERKAADAAKARAEAAKAKAEAKKKLNRVLDQVEKLAD